MSIFAGIATYNECHYKEVCYLSHVLPDDFTTKKKTAIQAGLLRYLLLLKATKQTYQALEDKKFKAFDALIGNNLCQITAFFISIMSSQCEERLACRIKEIGIAITKIVALVNEDGKGDLSKKALNKGLDLNITESEFRLITLGGVLGKGLEIPLSKLELMFVQLYLLTVVNEERSSSNPLIVESNTNYKKLQVIANITNPSGFVTRIREKTAKDMTSFIRNLAQRSPELQSLKFLSTSTILTHNRLQCPPFFRSTDQLIESALEQKVPLIFWVKQISTVSHKALRELCLYYQPMEGRYEMTNPTIKERGKPAMLVQASAYGDPVDLPLKFDWRIGMSYFDASGLIKAASAAHRQYPNSEVNALIEEDSKLIEYKAKADKWGCSLNNPSLFFISHISCEKIDNLAAFKSIFDSHLTKYYDFYRQQCVKEMRFLLNKHLEAYLELHGDYVKVKGLQVGEQDSFLRRVEQKLQFCRIVPKIKDVFDDGIVIELTIGKSAPFLLKTALAHAEPVEFLFDHKQYWGWSSFEITKFLVFNSASYKHSAMLDYMIEILRENQYTLEVQQNAIGILGQALKQPESKEFAKLFLMEFLSSTDKYPFRRNRLKQYALHQLSQILSDDDVKVLFQRIQHSHSELNIFALNYLEHPNFSAGDIETERVNFETIKSQALNFEYAYWSCIACQSKNTDISSLVLKNKFKEYSFFPSFFTRDIHKMANEYASSHEKQEIFEPVCSPLNKAFLLAEQVSSVEHSKRLKVNIKTLSGHHFQFVITVEKLVIHLAQMLAEAYKKPLNQLLLRCNDTAMDFFEPLTSYVDEEQNDLQVYSVLRHGTKHMPYNVISTFAIETGLVKSEWVEKLKNGENFSERTRVVEILLALEDTLINRVLEMDQQADNVRSLLESLAPHAKIK